MAGKAYIKGKVITATGGIDKFNQKAFESAWQKMRQHWNKPRRGKTLAQALTDGSATVEELTDLYWDASGRPSSIMIRVNHEITDKRISDLLCSAFEGGTGYWCMIRGYKNDDKAPGWLEEGDRKFKHIWVPLVPNGVMILGEDEDQSGNFLTSHELTRIKIAQGLDVMAKKYPKHFRDFLEEQEDATTADVFLQCCLLGRVVYG